MPDAPFSLKLYRWLLRLHPASFFHNYANAMEREFRDELDEAQGFWALAALWIRLLTDLAISIPAQISREVSQDVRYTLRLWAGRPMGTVFAIAALAIGIGANTGVFSVVNALLLRSLPFREPSRLVSLHDFIPPRASAKEFHDWRQQSAYLADVTLLEQYDANLWGAHNAGRVHIAQTSWNFFSVLGAAPILGRGFTAEEDTPGHNAVAVISYGLWQQLFAGDRRVLGSAIRIDGNVFVGPGDAQGAALTIVGVARPDFDFPGGAVLWKPAAFSPGNNGWETIARLKDGVTWPQAREAFEAEVDRLAASRGKLKRAGPRPKMASLQAGLAGPVKNASLMLMAGVVLILLIACANVANLLMARTADRAAELSIRSALGASRARLVQQFLTECLLLSIMSATAGLVVAFWTTSIATKVQPPPLAVQTYSILDGRVLGFTMLTAILSSLFFGVLPSLYAGRLYASGARGSRKTRGSRVIREALVAAQIMLTIVLLTSSVSVGRAFVRLMQTDRGFNVNGLVTVSVSLEGTTHQTAHRQLPYFDEALSRIRRIPGVRSASATVFLPLYATTFLGGPFGLDGRPAKMNSMMVPVLSDYFLTMGGSLLRGREFTDAEVHSDARVAVVNERFAREFGDPVEALGHQLTLGNLAPRKIIGVVKATEYETEDANSLQVFVPAQSPGGFFSTFVARVDGRAQGHLSIVRDAIRSVDPTVPVFGVKTMEQRLADTFARPRFYRTAALIFAGFALLLAVIGIYGVVFYAVVQRTQEMGIRMALGTTPIRLRGILLRQGLLTVAAGAIPGLAGAWLSGRFLESLIEGAKSVDLAASTFSVLFIVLVASVSIWAATRRIDGLDIMAVLRTE